MKKRMGIRIISYFLGLLILTMGISVSVKSDLGVSPVSSIPYTLTCVWGIEMGKATILFHVGLILLQILLLRKEFQMKNLLQLPVGIVFGYFTTFCNYLVTFIPASDNMVIRLVLMLVSTVLIAFGIFLYVPADIMPLAGEGAMLAMAQVSGKPFPTVKIVFDVSMVVISLIVCLLTIHSMGSVGIGTVAAALLVGIEIKWMNGVLGKKRDAILADT